MERISIMSEPVRVAMIMGKMIGGGVESVVMNYYREIDKSKFQFDFIVDKSSTIIPEEIEKLGGNVYKIASYENIKQFNKDLFNILNKNSYLIVHSHINTLNIFPLRIAKQNNVPIRISHNHSTSAKGELKKNVLKNILRLLSHNYATNFMAPTFETGKWLFGEKIANEKLYVLSNAISYEKFAFNDEVRKSIRRELGIKESDFIIGNIGRLVWQKNQMFLVQLLHELNDKKYKLLIIGDGPLKVELLRKIDSYKLNDYVIFIKNSDFIENYYQAMDLFAFPSNYEGLGMVAVEAQFSGLPVLASVNVPREVRIGNRIDFFNIEDNELWKRRINEISSISNVNRNGNLKLDIKNYDIKKEVKKLEKYYKNLLRKIS